MLKRSKTDWVLVWQQSFFTSKEFSPFYLYNNDTTEKCGLDDKCEHPRLDLRECHYYKKCNIILHDVYATRTGNSDKILYCGLCDSTKTHKWVAPIATSQYISKLKN